MISRKKFLSSCNDASKRILTTGEDAFCSLTGFRSLTNQIMDALSSIKCKQTQELSAKKYRYYTPQDLFPGEFHCAMPCMWPRPKRYSVLQETFQADRKLHVVTSEWPQLDRRPHFLTKLHATSRKIITVSSLLHAFKGNLLITSDPDFPLCFALSNI